MVATSEFSTHRHHRPSSPWCVTILRFDDFKVVTVQVLIEAWAEVMRRMSKIVDINTFPDVCLMYDAYIAPMNTETPLVGWLPLVS